MSRILKRPMFKTGGSTNEGIMHGLVDRRGYDNGGFGKRVKQRKSALDEIYSSIPMPTSRFPMGQIGLNLVSGEFAGDGFVQNFARSVKGPYEGWTKEQDALDRMKYQLDVTKTGQAVSDVTAMDMARAKAAGSGMQKDYSPQRNYRDFFLEFSKPAKDRYSKTIQNMYPHALAEYASYIQDNAFKTEQGSRFMQQVDGIIPSVIKSGQAQWQYEKMDPGAFYFHPQYKAFVQREPKTENKPEQLVVYDPYTFKETRRVNLG